VTLLVTLLRDFIAIKACCFRYKGKKQKPVTSLRDVIRKIFVVFIMKKNQNTSVYNTRNAKNWLIVYHLPSNTKQMLRVLSKNAIVTSLSVTEGAPFLSVMRNAFLVKVRLNQGKLIFRLKVI